MANMPVGIMTPILNTRSRANGRNIISMNEKFRTFKNKERRWVRLYTRINNPRLTLLAIVKEHVSVRLSLLNIRRLCAFTSVFVDGCKSQF